MIYVLTGKGKGKTTAALGMGLRAVGAGKRIFLVQFLKTETSSELKAINKIAGFEAKSFGRPGFFLPRAKLAKSPGMQNRGVKSLTKADRELAQNGFQLAKEKIEKDECDVLILDEINLALHFNLLPLREILHFLKKYGKIKDIVLTGRNCPKEIIQAADLVTECKEIKHYFSKGLQVKKGIEI